MIDEMTTITNVVEFYDNGKKKRYYGITTTGDLVGKYVEFYTSGVVRMMCSYYDNKRTGTYIENYVEGTPMVICCYKDDKLDGEYKEYSHETGEITTRQKYEGGIMKVQYTKPRITFR